MEIYSVKIYYIVFNTNYSELKVYGITQFKKI
jgi:hypothetical protein